MYIVFFRPIFSFKHFFRYPFKWVIRLFTKSKFHHVGHTVVKDDVVYISEAKSPYYRHIRLDECLGESKSKIYAYKVIVPYDKTKLQEFEKKMLGRDYDFTGAIYSEAHSIPFLNDLLEAEKGDSAQFCSESEVEMWQYLGLMSVDYNENHFSPQEYLELILNMGLVDPKPQIWELVK